MIYSQFQPHSSLSNYIDAYWTAKGNSKRPVIEKILPDGCIDIIFNLGDECSTDNGNLVMKSEGIYLVGTMTRFKETLVNADTNLLGIRFKPGAASAFISFSPLYQITNRTVELEKSFSFDAKKIIQNPLHYLDCYFNNELKAPNFYLLEVIETIRQSKGQIKVGALMQKHFTTSRQLERAFRQHVGVTPKDYINLVRYQNAMIAVRQRMPNQSLLSIAVDFGYYDHSHLTNEFKRYGGAAPTLA